MKRLFFFHLLMSFPSSVLLGVVAMIGSVCNDMKYCILVRNIYSRFVWVGDSSEIAGLFICVNIGLK